ncbi:hypothetical protein [Streptomyces sp. BBFR102]|uniref:hypothetical protein n=1 Tax=Streptomyces sp. BBFR102 TaxID=3448171 RepID=UPI003F531F8D
MACNDGSAGGAPSPGSGSSSAASSSSSPSDAAEGKSAGTPAQSGVKCTDQIDHAADPRSNAEINSIGVETGTCPPVHKK